MAVVANMVDCETVDITTLTGPGGRTGPLRVDFRYVGQSYSEAEARAAATRAERNHQVLGWGENTPPSVPSGAASVTAALVAATLATAATVAPTAGVGTAAPVEADAGGDGTGPPPLKKPRRSARVAALADVAKPTARSAGAGPAVATSCQSPAISLLAGAALDLSQHILDQADKWLDCVCHCEFLECARKDIALNLSYSISAVSKRYL